MSNKTQVFDELNQRIQTARKELKEHDGIELKQDLVSFSSAQARACYRQHVDEISRILCSHAQDSLPKDLASWTKQNLETLRIVRERLNKSADLAALNFPPLLENAMANLHLGMYPELSELSERLLRCGDILPKTFADELERFAISRAHLLNRNALEAAFCYDIIAALNPTSFYVPHIENGGSLTSVDTREITLGMQDASSDLRLPEAMFLSGDGTAFAYKIEATEEIPSYRTPCRHIDFTLKGNTSGGLYRRTLLLYLIPNIKSVPVLARRNKSYAMAPVMHVEFVNTDSAVPSEEVDNAFKRARVLASENALRFVNLCPQPSEQQTVEDQPLLQTCDKSIHEVSMQLIKSMRL